MVCCVDVWVPVFCGGVFVEVFCWFCLLVVLLRCDKLRSPNAALATKK